MAEYEIAAALALPGQAEEVDRPYVALSGVGSVMVELDSYSFAKRYAWVQDRFGVSWQLNFS